MSPAKHLCILATWALAITACTSDGRAPPEPDEPSPVDEGSYALTFNVGGEQLAIGAFVVERDSFAGDVVNVEGETFLLEGEITEDGAILVTHFSGDRGTSIEAAGAIREGMVEGTFVLDGVEGTFAGSRDNRPLDGQTSDAFDGSYEITFIRDEVEQAVVVLNIQGGRFATSITNLDDVTFRVRGFVTSDGTIVLNNVETDLGLVVLAEASVDHESGAITGIYRVPDGVGVVRGRIAD